MSIEIQSYFAEGERYPALIGVRAEGDEYETAYVSKSELVDALAENSKLQDELEFANDQCERAILELLDQQGQLKAENAKLRELVRDMWRDGMCECDERGACAECEYHFPDLMRELGVEVDA